MGIVLIILVLLAVALVYAAGVCAVTIALTYALGWTLGLEHEAAIVPAAILAVAVIYWVTATFTRSMSYREELEAQRADGEVVDQPGERESTPILVLRDFKSRRGKR